MRDLAAPVFVARALAKSYRMATSGQVRFLDHELTHADDNELTRFRHEHVGFVFQFYNLIPSLTARENVVVYPSDTLADGSKIDIRNAARR